MYVKRRSVTALYRFLLAGFALIGLVIELQTFGLAGWRLFAPWVMLFTGVYFLISALVTACFKRRSPGRMLSPMFEGTLIVANLTLIAGFIVAKSGQAGIPMLAGFAGVFTYLFVPILAILDWAVFCKKGQWRLADPCYFLSFFVVYACGILLSASFTPRAIILQYPYAFFDYHVIGIDTMLWWSALFTVLILATGYALFGLDIAWSGKLSKFIVLPRIKTIVIEETIEEVDEGPTRPVAKAAKSTKKPTAPGATKPKLPPAPKKSQAEFKETKSYQGQKRPQKQKSVVHKSASKPKPSAGAKSN